VTSLTLQLVLFIMARKKAVETWPYSWSCSSWRGRKLLRCCVVPPTEKHAPAVSTWRHWRSVNPNEFNRNLLVSIRKL